MESREKDAADWMRHMRAGDFESAWQLSDRVLQQRTTTNSHLTWDHHGLWRGENIDGRNVLISCRHGLGDTIQFIRYVPLVRGRARRVVVEAQPELIQLLRTVTAIEEIVPAATQAPNCDVVIEVMELPYVFRTIETNIPSDIPYFHVSPVHQPIQSFNVGLVWKAGDWDDRRSIPFGLLARLGRINHVTMHILQRGAGLEERTDGFGHASGSNDIFELARIMAGLDLVITVDSMPAHLAGALGVATWTLLHTECDWRWMRDRSDSPWYPSMRLFRQSRPGDWGGVMERVVNELEVVVSNQFPRLPHCGAAASADTPNGGSNGAGGCDTSGKTSYMAAVAG